MDNRQFAMVSHALTSLPSRRHVLHGLAALGLALGTAGQARDADAKKKKKKKTTLCLDGQTVQASGKQKKKLLKGGATPGACAAPPPPPPPPPPPGVPNAYGCFSVNVACTSADQCCTGICEGGVCKAHGTGVCDQEAAGFCDAANPFLTICHNSGKCVCLETTAGSKFCGAAGLQTCADCRKDADCAALGLPAGSACVPFTAGVCSGNCEGGMVCMPPCGTEPPPPEMIAPFDAISAGKRRRR